MAFTWDLTGRVSAGQSLFWPTVWVELTAMTDARFYNDKIYVPRSVREKLGLRNGDIVRFQTTSEGEVRLVILRNSEATQRLLKLLEHPPDLGAIRGGLSWAEIYENVA